MTTDVEITNIGPIENISIPVPEHGGVVVFRGRNGSGKSLALDAIDAAVTGKGRVPVRDGQLKGQVQAHGITMTIGRSTRRRGEAEVHSLEGKLSVADVVDPGIKDPESADAARIRALVGLLGPPADLDLFDIPAGVEVAPSTRDVTDIVDMAAHVKREIEAAARRAEDRAEEAARQSDAAKRAMGDDDPAWACPEHEVNDALESAIQRRSELQAAQMHGEDAAMRAETAQDHLEATTYHGPTFMEAETRRDQAMESVHEAEKALAVASSHAAACDKELRAATEYNRLALAWRADIRANKDIETITDEQVLAAEDAVAAARSDVTKAAAGRRASDHAVEAKAATGRQKAREAEAEQLRDAARSTDDVLSSIIQTAGVALSIKAVDKRLRLVTDTDRGVTPFGELSPGERWRMALDIAAEALGEGGELTIPQEAWEALDPANRAAIAQRVREHGIIVYTAEATDGPLDATIYDESDNP